MTRPRPLHILTALALVTGPLAAGEPPQVAFNRDVRPILADKCLSCHGPDEKHRKAGLRLDDAASALAPAESGARAIVPGDADASELWKRITTADADDVMPPPASHKTLSDEEKATLRRWIAEGARFQKHWAFEPPVKAAPPAAAEGISAIDAFLAPPQAAAGLAPEPEADRETLLRRVTFALTGLPPTLAEIDAFLADQTPGAYERVVDRLLASPRYGEQMARHWLDVARYGDTHGLHLDNERSIWPYRDWVVAAFNRNLPFDRFTVEQLAGDLLPSPTQDQLVATGFNRCNVTTSEGGSIDAEFLFRYAVDRTATTMQAWMGLTGQCAVCHDHKFDPISAKEFYSLYSFFYSAADPAMDGNALLTAPTLPLTSPAHEAKMTALAGELSAVQGKIDAALAQVAYTDPAALQPRPEPVVTEQVWVEDDAPAGASFTPSPGHPTRWLTTADQVPVLSGARALRRTDAGLAQDYYEGGAPAFPLPPEATLFAHVFLDPADPPRTIMLQFHKGAWQHRAVWGDYDAIDWGTRGTTERVHMGPLPKTGEWVRLEFPAEKVGLKPGDAVTGLAYTQFGGTVTWDKAGVRGRLDAAADPTQSLAAWIALNEKDPSKDLPAPVREALKTAPDKRSDAHRAALRRHFLASVHTGTRPTLAPLETQRAALEKQRADLAAALPSTFIMRDLPQPRQAHVMKRGQYDQPGDPVERAVPAILPALAKPAAKPQPDRLDLAEWLVSPAHPLTARVTVNRFWQQVFGTGLVATSGDFGSQGEPPSHPELLDWLAVTFREEGWDVKKLLRSLVTTQAFRRSSRVTPEAFQRDPANRLLARSPRLRLDAEELRDNALFLSGLLDGTFGGKGVRPYQPPNIWEPLGFTGSNTANYTQDKGSALYRRSLYVFFKRTAPPPFMANFDAPNREQFCARRERSNTPLQALQLMNDVQHFEAARALAARVLAAPAPTRSARLDVAFRTVTGRRADAGELAVVAHALDEHLSAYKARPEDARKVIANGESPPPPEADPAELAAWTMVANLLLNLDETVTRN